MSTPNTGLAASVRPLLAELREHPKLWALGLALLCTYGFFIGPPAWNQNSRLALTRALVEQGSVEIDDWEVTTGDKSFREGHFYSDKAPGVSLLSTLPYGLFVLERRLTSGDLPAVRVVPLDPAQTAADDLPTPEQRLPGDVLVYNPAQLTALWLCRMFAVSLPTLFAGALFYLLMLREFGGEAHARRWATGATLLWLLATPALGYSCGLYGHQLAADCLLAAFTLPILCPSENRGENKSKIEIRGLAVLVGGLLGWAVLSEYTAAVPVVLILVWVGWRRGLKFALWACAGGAPWALLLAAYHTWAFGSPLATGYDFVYLDAFAEGMAVAYGLGWPDPRVVGQLLFGSYRGLFYLSPVSLLAAWGLGLRLVQGDSAKPADSAGPGPLRRGDLLLALAIVLWYLGLNGGYYMWDGGAALGPRHAVPMLPFLALGFGPALRRVPWATLVLGIVACAQITLITAAGPEAPSHGNPLWAYALPELFTDAPQGSATTLGRLMGLPGPLSLAPLLLCWWLLVGGTGRADVPKE